MPHHLTVHVDCRTAALAALAIIDAIRKGQPLDDDDVGALTALAEVLTRHALRLKVPREQLP